MSRNKTYSAPLNVRLKPDVKEWLIKLAKEQDRSINNLINLLLTNAMTADKELKAETIERQ